jgi:hypothetical protein
MEQERPPLNGKEHWETPTVEIKGSLLDITAAAVGVGPNDGLFDEGPSA